ncbi:MAG: glycosyltransferase, partial [Bdellovibrionales bacterium]|nr:glycosyltransferase [Bdellovibrionales bacterium]
PDGARVIGHVGRLAAEKNLAYLTEAVARCLRGRDDAGFLVVGDGDERDEVSRILTREAGVGRAFVVGSLSGDDLTDAYAAIDVFAFSSQSETQGMVLAEAMAAGAPVVALDGPGVRDIVIDGRNGRLLDSDADRDTFAKALGDMLDDPELKGAWRDAALSRAGDFSTAACVEEMLACYGRAIAGAEDRRRTDPGVFQRL